MTITNDLRPPPNEVGTRKVSNLIAGYLDALCESIPDRPASGHEMSERIDPRDLELIKQQVAAYAGASYRLIESVLPSGGTGVMRMWRNIGTYLHGARNGPDGFPEAGFPGIAHELNTLARTMGPQVVCYADGVVSIRD